MNTKDLILSQTEVAKLLTCGNPDAAALCLYLKCGNMAPDAIADLGLTAARYSQAAAALRQLGLLEESAPLKSMRQPPVYSEEDVMSAMRDTDSFPKLTEAVESLLGKALNTEELKVILTFQRYLGLPNEVIYMLVTHCRDRKRAKGSLNPPSLRSIEKEAYIWAEQGIDTMEEASAYIRKYNARASQLAGLKRQLHIYDRPLTAAEERYADSWLGMRFDSEAIQMAYEKTCLNTGGLKWAYMNKILLSWHQQGLHTGSQIRSGDRKPAPRGSNAAQVARVEGGTAALGEFERDAIARMLREHAQNKEG